MATEEQHQPEKKQRAAMKKNTWCMPRTEDIKSSDWSNELVMEFLDAYRQYPVIWDPCDQNKVDKEAVNDAWCAIRDQLSLSMSVIALKKKKECLMTMYRMLLKRIRDNTVDGVSTYTPVWFAFNAMDSFLGRVYASLRVPLPQVKQDLDETAYSGEYQTKTENEDLADQLVQRCFTTKPGKTKTSPKKANKRRSCTRSPIKRKKPTLMISPKVQSTNKRSKKEWGQIDTIGTLQPKPQVHQFLQIDQQQEPQQSPLHYSPQTDECSLFTELLSAKLKAMNRRSRLIVINRIENLVFDAEMKEMDAQTSSFHIPHMQSTSFPSPSYSNSQPSMGERQAVDSLQCILKRSPRDASPTEFD